MQDANVNLSKCAVEQLGPNLTRRNHEHSVGQGQVFHAELVSGGGRLCESIVVCFSPTKNHAFPVFGFKDSYLADCRCSFWLAPGRAFFRRSGTTAGQANKADCRKANADDDTPDIHESSPCWQIFQVFLETPGFRYSLPDAALK